MKFKPTDKGGGVVVELGPRETRLPASAGEEMRETLPAFKLRRILVPVDFSECSRKALAYAIPFAEHFGAELTLLHVAPSNPPVPEMGPVDVVGIDDATKQLELLQAKVSAAVPSQSVVRVVRSGEPHIEIIQAAKELGIDLIVLSTHGRTGLARVVMGSTAEKVVRHAGCPVLVVREHEQDFVAGAEMGTEERARSR